MMQRIKRAKFQKICVTSRSVNHIAPTMPISLYPRLDIKRNLMSSRLTVASDKPVIKKLKSVVVISPPFI